MKDNKEELIVLEEVNYPVSRDEIIAFTAEWAEVPALDATAGVKDQNFLEVRAAHLKAVKFRTSIEKKRKQIVAPALDYQRKANTIAKEYTALLENVEHSLFTERHQVEQYKEREKQKALAAEKIRVDTLNEKIRALQDIPGNAIGGTSEEITKILGDMKEITAVEYEEKLDIAMFLHTEAIEKLEGMIAQAIKAEQADIIAKELAAKTAEEAAEAAAKLKEDRDLLDKDIAEFNEITRAAKEHKAMQQAEAEAEQLEKDQAAEAEQKKVEEKATLEKEITDKVAKIERASLDLAGLEHFSGSVADARYIIEDITNGFIEHVRFTA